LRHNKSTHLRTVEKLPYTGRESRSQSGGRGGITSDKVDREAHKESKSSWTCCCSWTANTRSLRLRIIQISLGRVGTATVRHSLQVAHVRGSVWACAVRLAISF